MQSSNLLKSLFILFVCLFSCFIGFIIAGYMASKYVKTNQSANYFKASDNWYEFGTPLKEINGKCITSATTNIFKDKSVYAEEKRQTALLLEDRLYSRQK